ncbi:hypothetical protein [Paraburkholderia sp. J41]|uniref:hypothetical protein n=1 Tax=Paraburkholderia sp. J41 TaxID=2805433 RepID=UPI002AC36856|nr:hypothetical protein [Paraburkholderia sp. J41]
MRRAARHRVRAKSHFFRRAEKIFGLPNYLVVLSFLIHASVCRRAGEKIRTALWVTFDFPANSMDCVSRGGRQCARCGALSAIFWGFGARVERETARVLGAEKVGPYVGPIANRQLINGLSTIEPE